MVVLLAFLFCSDFKLSSDLSAQSSHSITGKIRMEDLCKKLLSRTVCVGNADILLLHIQLYIVADL